MKRALVIHGMPSREEYYSQSFPAPSNSHWFPWLQRQLQLKDIFCQTPEMPEPFNPDYIKWKTEFEQFKVDSETTLVGHSCGGGFLVRWLSENEINIDRLILVSPWLDPNRLETTNFFDFQINPVIQDRLKSIDILISDNDNVEGVKESVKIISSHLPKARIHQFSGKGHFTIEEMKTEELPDLLDLILAE